MTAIANAPWRRPIDRLCATIGAEWAMVAAYGAAAIAIYGATGTRLELGQAGTMLIGLPVLAGIGMFYRYIRPAPPIADLIGAMLRLFLILLLGLLISFPAATLGAGFPYRDDLLRHADAALGLDWEGYFAFVTGHPALSAILHGAYFSMQPQFFLTAAALVVAGQKGRLHDFILATGITLAVTLALFVFVPALAHPGGSWVVPLDYMRAAGRHVVSCDELNGIVTFPSYHTISAILFIWANWRVPYLRWPALVLNLALIASVPVQGLHYFVDAIGGAVIAAAVLGAMAWRRGRGPR